MVLGCIPYPLILCVESADTTRYARYCRWKRACNDIGDMKESREDFATALRRKLAMPQIPALNGIRAIAVFLVIFYHYGLRLPGGFNVPGAHGVLIFFVLSGFLITWLLLKENEKYGRISLKGFYRRRVLRIFPAFYFYWILLVAILLLGHHEIVWLHTISSFLYL